MKGDKNNEEKKQELLKPKGAGKARVICALLIVLAVFIGGRGSLNRLRNEALDYFFSGDPENSLDYGIQYDLEQRVISAKNLVVVAKRYLSENEAAITNVENDCEKITESDEPNVKYEYNEELTDDCYALVQILDMVSMSEADEDYCVELIVKMDSSNQIIGHSQYNTKATEFNALLKKFPTSIVSKIAFVKPLALFNY